MRIELTQGPEYTETEILIRCPQVDEDILRMVALLRISEQKITGLKDGEILPAGRQGYPVHRHRRQAHLLLYGRRSV